MLVVLLETEGSCYHEVSIVKSKRKIQCTEARGRKVDADPAQTLKKSSHRVPEKGPRKLRLRRWRLEEGNPGHGDQGQFTKERMAGLRNFLTASLESGRLVSNISKN